MVIGTVVAVMRISPIAPLRAVGLVYVEFFRNIPLLCLLFLVVFGLPDIGLLFSLYNSAVHRHGDVLAARSSASRIRTGINTVQVGQAEAARSIGLTFGQSLRFVILPQALRSMVQPLVNVWIGTLIGSSLASVIGIQDVTAVGQNLNNRYAGGLAVFASIARNLRGHRVCSPGRSAAGSNVEWRCSDERSTRVLFDQPGPRTRRRIRIYTGASLVVIAAFIYLAIARFADSGQLAGAKWNVFTAPWCGRSSWDGLVNTMKLTVVSGVLARARSACYSRCSVGAQQGAALVRHRLRRGVPVGAAVAAGVDVRAGAAATGHQPADLLEDLRADRDVQRRGAGRDLPGRGERPAQRPAGGLAGHRPDATGRRCGW